MQGTVLSYNDAEGKGLISGDDGERYSFTRADLQQLKPITTGMRVDFRKEDECAREIFLLGHNDAGTGGATIQETPVSMDVSESHPSTKHHVGMWGYFKKCMGMYVNGHGRATRGEYWSFVLFSWISILAPVVLGFMVAGTDFYEYSAEPSPAAILLWCLAGLVYVAMIIPNLTVLIRRLHDLGLTGWLVLLGLIPYVGGLIIFVMSLIPGQQGANKHGPDPQASKPQYVPSAA